MGLQGLFSHFLAHFKTNSIGLDKSGHPLNIFISPQKHMLWVLIRSASSRRF